MSLSDERILELIDARISAGLRVHTNSILNHTRSYTNALLQEQIYDIKKDLKATVEDIFQNMEFIDKFKKHIFVSIEQKINSKFSEEGLNDTIRGVAKSVTKDVFKGIMDDVVSEVVKSLNKKLEYDLKVSKELCYSIDRDIKHVLMKSPSSPSVDELIINRVNDTINVVSEKMIRNDMRRIGE